MLPLGCAPEIKLGLHADPQFWAGTQGIGELQRHVSGDSRAAVQDARQGHPSHSQVFRGVGDGHLSVVVLIVHQHGVFAFKCERQAPVSAGINRTVVLQIAVQGINLQLGAFMSLWDLALSSAASCSFNLSACSG